MTPLSSAFLQPLLRLQDAPAAPPSTGGDDAAGGGFGDSFLVPMLLVVGIMYVVLFLPERKKQKKREAMLGAMKKGDEVMTSAGLYGSISQIKDDIVTLQVADGVKLRFNRAAIQNVLTADAEEDKKKKS